MRTKKVRGHKRIWKRIDQWVASQRHLDPNEIMASERAYARILIHPYSSLSVVESSVPPPKGETRRRMLSGLVEIYTGWKRVLDELEQPYYLKIWIFDPNFERSQVVCSLGSMIDFYRNAFHKPEGEKEFPFSASMPPSVPQNAFHWEYHLEEMYLTDDEVAGPEAYATRQDYLAHKRWFERQLRKPHRMASGTHAFPVGDVWTGQLR